MSKIRLCAFADEAGDSLREQIDAMHDNGIELLELRGVDGKNVSELSVSEAKAIKNELDAANIKVWALGSPIGKIKITDDFAPELEKYKRILEIAAATEAKCIRMFSFYGTEGKAEYRDEVMERLSKYVELARGTGVVLCHENEKGIYGDIATRCLDIHKTIPELKAVFDPANFVQCGQDTLEAWEMLEPYVYYGHIKDSDTDGNIVPAGMGAGNIPLYLPKFVAKGCDVLTLEPHLTVFSGLAGLEEEGDRSKVGKTMSFGTKLEAFKCATDALKGIINNL